ncbi:helix-turn-helix transcriptional regulator, partial [Paeniglutamicibacter cryotolerans]
RRYFDEDELVEPLKTLADQGDCNFILVPRTKSRYYEYAPLFHMLSARKLKQFGLPFLRMGQWPFQIAHGDVDRYLPHDFEGRLANAWASAVWPHLVSGSPLGAFSKNDPLKLLAHNLDYWIPPVTSFMQSVLGEFSLVEKDVEIPSRVQMSDGSFLEGVTPGFPRMGGDIWTGEEEAAEAVRETVENADSTGQLRGIIDTIRSHRAHDDFSPRWSHAREDFERKINHTRSKVKVSFIELPDTVPVQGPETEVVGNIVTTDFLTLLDPKEREIVVLLTSGFTRQAEIAEKLGYSTHSAVSKRLAKIRKKAEKYFE